MLKYNGLGFPNYDDRFFVAGSWGGSAFGGASKQTGLVTLSVCPMGGSFDMVGSATWGGRSC